MPDGTVHPAQAMPPAEEQRRLRALAIGVNWFQSGSGGLDRVFRELMQSLGGAGVDATGVVLGPPDVSAQTHGRVIGFGNPGAGMPERLWRARTQVSNLLRMQRFDLTAAHFAMFALPALDHLRRLPFVFHFHGPWADESAQEGAGGLAVAGKRLVERAVYRRADRMIVLSNAFGAIARDIYGVPEDRIRKVPGTVDADRFHLGDGQAAARAALGWPNDRRVIVSVRRLARRMGLDRLLTAMADIVRAHPDALLMLAGRGHMEGELRAQVETLGLSQNVRFLGFVPDADLPLIYRAAEINVIPTVALEGFGLTTVEALASGTPSFVAPVGGLPEVVGDLSPDLVFASGEPVEIAARLKAALAGTLRLPSAQACRDYAVSRYGADVSAAAVAAVYREVV